MKTRNLRPCGGAGWGELEGALDPWLLEKISQGFPFNFLGLGMAGRELHPLEPDLPAPHPTPAVAGGLCP